MEKRRHQRMTINNLWADVSDGKGFYSGMVTDLSRFGLRLTDLPLRCDTSQRLSIVVSGQGKNFKMLARPCWTKKDNTQKSVGVEIMNASWGWTEFVMSHEPPPVDVWGEVALRASPAFPSISQGSIRKPPER
ncbi:MAG: PilZ domain-containing protein [Desulfoprunum sp.]